jgi:hypothetical protein
MDDDSQLQISHNWIIIIVLIENILFYYIYIYMNEGWENGMIITICQPLFSTFYNDSPKGVQVRDPKIFQN